QLLFGYFPADNRAVVETFVVLLARVFHYPIVGRLDSPLIGNGPRLRVRFRIVYREGVFNVAKVDALEGLRYTRLITERVANRIDTDVTVDIRCFDDERVSIPVTDRFAPPCGRQVLRERAAIGGHEMEPGILFGEKNDLIVVLDDVNRMGAVDGARESKREATAGIVSVFHRVI